eukprot:SAG31_NODE_866_length_11370_cov_4.806761_7_plen_42_part_00
MEQTGANVLMVEYRGYGSSEGDPSEVHNMFAIPSFAMAAGS